jgi:hypothetical protein
MFGHFSRFACSTLAVLGLSAVSSAAPVILIDDFSKFEIVYDVTADGTPTFGTPSTDASFLGTRTLSSNRIAGGVSHSVSSGSGIGALDVSGGSGFGSATFAYSLAPLNFGMVDGFFQIDADTDRVSLTGGRMILSVNGVSAQQFVGGEALTSYTFAFSQFAGVDFANVTDIVLTLEAVDRGADINVYSFEAREVPEPATFAIVGIGLIAAGLLRRNKTRKA